MWESLRSLNTPTLVYLLGLEESGRILFMIWFSTPSFPLVPAYTTLIKNWAWRVPTKRLCVFWRWILTKIWTQKSRQWPQTTISIIAGSPTLLGSATTSPSMRLCPGGRFMLIRRRSAEGLLELDPDLEQAFTGWIDGKHPKRTNRCKSFPKNDEDAGLTKAEDCTSDWWRSDFTFW